jgi:D-alanyl-lipoteichoic acid acyltransferase DltB (MBOAT superfamily)
LGGSKSGKIISVRNTFIIFLVSGFWHGASWNFIIWGAIHAIGFLPLLLLNKNKIHKESIVAEFNRFPSLSEVFKMLATFSFVTVAWIFFRFPEASSALAYIKKILYEFVSSPFNFFYIPQNNRLAIFLIGLLLICDWYLRRDERSLKVPIKNRILRYAFYILLIILIHLNIGRGDNSFIYFQF